MKKKYKSFKDLNRIAPATNLLFNVTFIVMIFVLCIFPLLTIIGSSFTVNKEILLNGYNVWPKEFTIEAYDFVLRKSNNMINAYGVTIVVTLIGTIGGVAMMSMYAYAISRKDLKYHKFFSFFIYFTFIFNGGLVPFYFVYSRLLNLNNTLAVLIIPFLVDAWYVVILRTFFSTSVPESIIASAKIDGAGELRIFFSIVVQLAIPGIATIALFQTLKYWNDFMLPLYFIDTSDKWSINYMLYRLLRNMEFLSQNTKSISLSGPLPVEAARMAMCVLGTGPMLLAYPFFQRFFVKGLTLGAVKG